MRRPGRANVGLSRRRTLALAATVTVAALAVAALAVAALAVAAVGLLATTFTADPLAGSERDSGLGADSSTGRWPSEPPARICGNQDVLGGGPTEPPDGAVIVPAGGNSGVDFGRAATTYWFAPGTHTLGGGEFSQIAPDDGSRFVGAPGAVLDGQGVNKYTFVGHGSGVTVEYLTIRGFVPSNSESAVNHSAGEGWTIRFNTIRDNRGAGVNVGTDNVVAHNCLTRNGQYGLKSYRAGAGPSNIAVDHNEISYNNTDDWETRKPGCGCTGGAKFWSVSGAAVTNNYVHHNFGPGLWADTNDVGFLIEGNYISENDSVGIFYEISYNALIRNNTLVRNALEAGADNAGFPTGAIYISEAGGDSRVDSAYGALHITGNRLTDNWGGVVLWENANRFCSSPKNPTDDCTLVNPAATLETCTDPADGGLVGTEPYYSDCRWKTRNVKIHGNVFQHDPSSIGPECTFENHCGVMSVLSNWGSWPDWSPYRGDVVQQAITFGQGNVWSDNTYRGQWRFVPVKAGNLLTFAQWQSPPYGQDEGSSYH